jgi:hypothetical protein
MIALGAVLLGALSGRAPAQDKGRTIAIAMKVPSTAYKVKIERIYQTRDALLVLSSVEGKGVGLTVISNAKDQVAVNAPKDLPVKHFVVGKSWNWGDEKYTFLKSRDEFEKLLKNEMAMKIYEQPKAPPPPAGATFNYIIMYKKEIFTNGKTNKGETLEELGKRHAREFKGEFGRTLQIIDGCTMRLTPEAANRLGKLPEVKLVEKDQPIGIN